MRSLNIIILVLITLKLCAQGWHENLPKNKKVEDLTLHDYQNAFNEYWDKYNVKGGYYINEDGEKQKVSGWNDQSERTSPSIPELPPMTPYRGWDEVSPAG